MNLDELKKSMSTLDDVLAQKNIEPISFNTETCSSAQSRIAKQYRKSILNCGVLAVVFIILWLSGTGESAFPVAMKGFLGIFMAVAAIVYMVLYRSIKKIQPATSTPMRIMKQVASLRLYTLVAEIFFTVVLAVFFTIFLSNLWSLGTWTFWLVSGALLVSLIIALIMLPKKIRDFRELTAVD
ncbi:MAG: hypothetical protein K2M54_09085 [Muribaculaceae bacterium]|nr:hypothetical protein [Muribaculaceae bacterium]